MIPRYSTSSKGQLFETGHQTFRREAPVGLDVTQDDVDACGARLACRLEHAVGLADTRRGAEKYFQMSSTGIVERP